MVNFQTKIKKLEKLKNKKIFIISGRKSKSFFLRKIKKSFFLKNKIHYFYKKKNFPEINELKRIIKNFNNYNPSVVISVGGGTAIDYAKLCINLKNSKNLISDIKSNKIYKNKKILLLSYITTAGSGAEFTNFSVIYIGSKKYSYSFKNILNNNFIYDQNAVLNLPKNLRSSCGFDNFSQCFESFFSLQSNKKSLFYARRGLTILNKYFLRYIILPNKYNSNKMIEACIYSGKAINISKTNAPHAFSYPFSKLLKINHGSAVALNFLNIIDLFYKKKNLKSKNFFIEDRFKLLFKIFKVRNYFELRKKINNILNSGSLNKKNFIKKKELLKNLSYIYSHINKERLKNSPFTIKKSEILQILKKY